MDSFKLKSEYKPTGDQPQAIQKLTEGVLDGVRTMDDVAQLTTLDCSDYDIDNTVESPNAILPQQSPVATSGNAVETTIPAKTFALYRIGAK